MQYVNTSLLFTTFYNSKLYIKDNNSCGLICCLPPPPLLTRLSPKKMSVATRFIPPSEKSIRDSWIGDCRAKNMERVRISKNTNEMKTPHIIHYTSLTVTPGFTLENLTMSLGSLPSFPFLAFRSLWVKHGRQTSSVSCGLLVAAF